MRELHAIREKHYEETKHMTTEEYIKWVNERARRVMKEYGMESKYHAPDRKISAARMDHIRGSIQGGFSAEELKAMRNEGRPQ